MSEVACSIEGCGGKVLARGWCGKHYSRWRNHGDPLMMKTQQREPDAPVAETRWVGKHEVHWTVEKQPFVMETRTRSGVPVRNRRYGVVITCEKCGKEAFIKESGGKLERRFCSHKCAGPVVARQRRIKKPAKTVATADATFSKLVRLHGACVNCGKTERLQCAHGFSRRYRNTRWSFDNAFCLCASCHMYFTYRPLEWEDWMRDRMGDDAYDALRNQALQTTKVDVAAVLEWLTDLWDKYRDAGAVAVPGHAGWVGLSHAEIEKESA